MKSEGYGGRAGGQTTRDYTKPLQRECWLHGKVNCDDCTADDSERCYAHGLYACADCAGKDKSQWRWQDDNLVTDEHYTLARISNDEALLDEVARDVDAVERGDLPVDEFIQTWGDEVADEFLTVEAWEKDKELYGSKGYYGTTTTTTPAPIAPGKAAKWVDGKWVPADTGTTTPTGPRPASWQDWKPGDPYPASYYAATASAKSWVKKPFWSESLSLDYMRSGSAKSKSIARRRDRRQGYRACPAGRHWGPAGAAGILPYAVREIGGEPYVALGKRSKSVQHGGTWAQFGGAVDKKDAGPWEAAMREVNEEVEGLAGKFDEDDIVAEFRWDCPAGCGWYYIMYVVRVHTNGKLPKLSVKTGARWETDMLAWVPLDAVEKLDLHFGMKRGWARTREAIEKTEAWLATLESEEAGA
jgi:8-oxo-dGTP pyrophosphatase MutT (NUDIX family)